MVLSIIHCTLYHSFSTFNFQLSTIKIPYLTAQKLPLHSAKQPIISRTVWLLSLVSLFTDVASEMLYPVMPIFLKHIGFSVVLIGVLEGIADALSGLSKPWFGQLSDSRGKRLPFVQWGYALSALSKPLMAAFVWPLWIFFARTLDRLGKGIRTGARDAMLSDEATAATKGRVFGFHRSMDSLGAVLGPLLALGFLYYWPYQYKTLFLIAFLPGLLAVAASFLIREKKHPPRPRPRPGLFAFLGYWKNSPPVYKRLVTGLLFFALFNSSDVFLLLKLKEGGLTDTAVIAIYIFYNLVYALSAYPAGILADRLGMKKVLLSGLLVFAVVYAGFAFCNTLPLYIALFALYGLYSAATGGIAKAWISNLVPRGETATALGTFGGLQSLAMLAASSLTGLMWYYWGSQATFCITAGASLLAIAYLSRIKTKVGGDAQQGAAAEQGA
jgi:MFS family permease